MTFEEIKQIEKGPDYNFYFERLERICYGNADIDLYYHIVLTTLYLKKFDEKYGTNICPVERSTGLCCHKKGCEDLFYEEIYTYEYDALEVLLRVAETYKFETHICIHYLVDVAITSLDVNIALFDIPKGNIYTFFLKDTIQQHRLFQNWLELFLRKPLAVSHEFSPFLGPG